MATRPAREIISCIIAASVRLLVVRPASASTAPTPMSPMAVGGSAPGTSRLVVATVRSRCRPRLRATARVVVPLLIMMVELSSTNAAASAAIFSFSCRLSRWSTARSVRGGDRDDSRVRRGVWCGRRCVGPVGKVRPDHRRVHRAEPEHRDRVAERAVRLGQATAAHRRRLEDPARRTRPQHRRTGPRAWWSATRSGTT